MWSTGGRTTRPMLVRARATSSTVHNGRKSLAGAHSRDMSIREVLMSRERAAELRFRAICTAAIPVRDCGARFARHLRTTSRQAR